MTWPTCHKSGCQNPVAIEKSPMYADEFPSIFCYECVEKAFNGFRNYPIDKQRYRPFDSSFSCSEDAIRKRDELVDRLDIASLF